MQIKQNISLKPYNTFGIDVNSTKFVEINSIEDFRKVLASQTQRLLILGGGSNLLFTEDFDGTVVKNNIKGIDILKDNGSDVLIKVGAGEVWHQFVLYCLENHFAGVENLSLIPGSVGASPIQNIGAYGAEVKDLIMEVEAFDIEKQEVKKFSNSACKFGYRTSIFKTSEKGNYLISSVTFRLSKIASPDVSYGAISSELEKMQVITPTIRDVSNAVINIRSSKLPDPKIIGNSGSFFKNPVVSLHKKNKILERYPEAPNYKQENNTYKIAAGWLIEKCDWKGRRIDNYGVHEKQALVLVNYGGAKGSDIFDLSEAIIKSVNDIFGIVLEREVNIL